MWFNFLNGKRRNYHRRRRKASLGPVEAFPPSPRAGRLAIQTGEPLIVPGRKTVIFYKA